MVLTIYAAIMLPRSLIAGFSGMNFVDLPGSDSSWGWSMATGDHGPDYRHLVGCLRCDRVDPPSVGAEGQEQQWGRAGFVVSYPERWPGKREPRRESLG